MKGIYVIHLPEMEKNIYKIGCSKDIKSRIDSFNNDTLRLYPVEVVYTKEFEDYKKAEKEIHKQLKKYRVNSKREFFKCDLYYILQAINNVYTKLRSEEYYLSDVESLEYYYHYLPVKNINLIIKQKYIPTPREIYFYINNFIKNYKAVETKIITLPECNKKQMYKDLLKEMNIILYSGKIEEYLEIDIQNNRNSYSQKKQSQ